MDIVLKISDYTTARRRLIDGADEIAPISESRSAQRCGSGVFTRKIGRTQGARIYRHCRHQTNGDDKNLGEKVSRPVEIVRLGLKRTSSVERLEKFGSTVCASKTIKTVSMTTGMLSRSRFSVTDAGAVWRRN